MMGKHPLQIKFAGIPASFWPCRVMAARRSAEGWQGACIGRDMMYPNTVVSPKGASLGTSGVEQSCLTLDHLKRMFAGDTSVIGPATAASTKTTGRIRTGCRCRSRFRRVEHVLDRPHPHLPIPPRGEDAARRLQRRLAAGHGDRRHQATAEGGARREGDGAAGHVARGSAWQGAGGSAARGCRLLEDPPLGCRLLEVPLLLDAGCCCRCRRMQATGDPAARSCRRCSRLQDVAGSAARGCMQLEAAVGAAARECKQLEVPPFVVAGAARGCRMLQLPLLEDAGNWRFHRSKDEGSWRSRRS
eukprot:gene22328-biopygen17721